MRIHQDVFAWAADAYAVAHNYWPAVIHFYRSHHGDGAGGSDSEVPAPPSQPESKSWEATIT